MVTRSIGGFIKVAFVLSWCVTQREQTLSRANSLKSAALEAVLRDSFFSFFSSQWILTTELGCEFVEPPTWITPHGVRVGEEAFKLLYM